ncbi:MAG: hypothetical protein IJO05_05715 [Oscillospiraceae bacterium]|nr:hypothetical protein [Oscillospiraceae bacterium]
MSEHYLTGYCRCLDNSRIVEVVTEDGHVEECDCLYGACKFQSQCAIAQNIEELTEAQN